MKQYETILVEEPLSGVLQVTLNRPGFSNAFNTQTGRDLFDVFHPLELGHRQYRCVVLTGAGDKAFCAGGDLKERKTLTEEEWVLQHELFERTFRHILNCPLPVLAAVNGSAFGGGLELMMLCDFAYASRTARFALTEVSLGIMPGGAGTQTLARAAGERRAKELILTAMPFSAEEALAWVWSTACSSRTRYWPKRWKRRSGSRRMRRSRCGRPSIRSIMDCKWICTRE